MKKMLIAALLATLAGALTFGAAASLSVSADDLGSGDSLVASCDLDGVTVEWINPAPVLSAAKVTGIDDRCDGQQLTVTVDGTLGLSLSMPTIVPDIDGADEAIALFSFGVVAEAIESVSVTIAGPADS